MKLLKRVKKLLKKKDIDTNEVIKGQGIRCQECNILVTKDRAHLVLYKYKSNNEEKIYYCNSHIKPYDMHKVTGCGGDIYHWYFVKWWRVTKDGKSCWPASIKEVGDD